MTTSIVQAPVKLNRQDAANYLGLQKSTLEAWATAGRGPRFLKSGSKVWYLQRELDRWIDSRMTNCTSTLDQ